MNIIGLSVLQELRKLPGLENAIIAGGFVRDGILGGDFTDIDIFVPCTSSNNFNALITKIKGIERYDVFLLHDNQDGDIWSLKDGSTKEIDRVPHKDYKFIVGKYDDKMRKYGYEIIKEQNDVKIGNFSGWKKKKNQDYDSGVTNYLGHFDLKYHDRIDVDLIGTRYDGLPEKFGHELIKTFHYNIDQTFFDGVDTIMSDAFNSDHDNRVATLNSLNSIYELPRAMKKFFKFQEKYSDFGWSTNILELKERKTTDSTKYGKSGNKSWTTTTITNF